MSKHMMFSRSLHFPVIFIFGATLLAAGARAQAPAPAQSTPPLASGAVVEDIVARVNDQIITQSDYDRALQQLESEGKEQGLLRQQIETRKQDLLRDLVDQQLLLSKGKDLGITGENELIRRLDDIRKQNHLDSMEALEKAAQAQGVSYEDFKANIRNSIITQQVVQNEVSRHLALTQAEVQNYYKAHQSEFSQPESVHLSEILIATPANADPAQVAAAQANAEAVEAKLKGGAKFDEVAKSASSGPTAAQGGDLGDFRRGMLAPQLEEKTFILQAGQFTEPIRTKQGFVILQVTHHTAGGDTAFKEVAPQVEEAVFMQHMQPALRQYLTKLREAAYVDIKPGLVDSGASPNEIHPTYSAYEPPATKQKVHFTRARYHAKQPTTTSNAQAVKTAPAATASSAPNTSAAPGGAASAAQAPQQVAKSAPSSVEKPGKREKIRYGQAPRESLPAAQGLPNTPTAATQTAASAPSTATQTASVTNPDVRDLNPNSTPGAQAPADATTGKTRFSSRPVVHKTKEQKQAEANADQPSQGTPQELADQKVQSAPVGLAEPSKEKKKKEKGEKTRYAAKKEQPDQTQQPYMPPQQPAAASPAGGAQPQATSDQAPPKTPDRSPQ
ncbi:MAG TPA: peptidylprolyl isomerase [Acidobacteriaceae bacterium]